jgi:F-type H+-transporting ATPase subunit gamma
MPTLIDFRRRIRSVKNTQQITRAMKFVAAARLRRAQERVFAARPFAGEMVRVLRSAMSRMENPMHPLLAHRPEERVLVLVLTGDRGLCGPFNTNVIRKSLEFLREHQSRKLEIVPVGKKGRDALRKRQYSFLAEYLNVSMRVEFARAKEIAGKVIERFTAGEVDAVYAIYNEFKSVLVQRLTVEKLLPVEADAIQAAEPGGHGAHAVSEQPVDYIYEQPAGEILDKLLPRYVETQVYRVLVESAAAEHAARMTAMDAATNNAAELIEKVTLHMNKVRQAQITKEIIEVVSGAASAAQ